MMSHPIRVSLLSSFLLACGWAQVSAPVDMASAAAEALEARDDSATAPAAQTQLQQISSVPRDLTVTVGKSLVVESPVAIQRVSIANERLAEALAVTPREVLINGKEPGETSLIVWQQGGNRLLFDLFVRPSTLKLDAVRSQLNAELAGQDVNLSVEDGSVFLRGTVKDLVSGERAAAIAGVLGKVVNLLNVKVPAVEAQILLKVRFANVDRTATSQLGANIVSTGAGNTLGSVSTQQFGPASLTSLNGRTSQFNLSDLLNVFLFRPDLNLAATIKALQSRSLLEILAEPNLLAMNGKPAAFLAGGEFPVPVVQAGIGGAGAISIQWREFGVRLNFVPTITPRGTVRLVVSPEVSSLDFANALVITGFTVPAISTRRIQTEIELESGQSFAIAGLLDRRVTEQLNKIPGIGDIPVLGKMFQSRSVTKSDTELLVMVTPELVRPIPANQPQPEIQMPRPFDKGAPTAAPRTPGLEATGPVPVKPTRETIPFEQLEQESKPATGTAPATMGPIQLVPVPTAPAQTPPAAAPSSPTPGVTKG